MMFLVKLYMIQLYDITEYDEDMQKEVRRHKALRNKSPFDPEYVHKINCPDNAIMWARTLKIT